MKKVLVIFSLLIFLSFSAFAAENNTSDSIDKAYSCLRSEIGNRTVSEISLQEATFGTLALGSVQKLRDKIEDERSSDDCWPRSSCRLKETAQVLLAYDAINRGTSDIEKYLYKRNGTATDLTWFLLIDISPREQASCTIKSSSSTRTITVGEDMKISGDPGNCLTIVESGYWMRISSSCLDRQFDISCNKDFVTTLLYQKSGIDTIFVSSEAHSSASLGTTTEEVKAKCFKQGSSCNYEGTLWAALALQQAGEDVEDFIPYIVALAPENENLLPESFIFKLTNADDHYSSLVQQQRQNKYWEAPSTPNNRFYDTSLALLALQGRESSEAENAESYLLDIQSASGCWNNNNIRDTAFILYSAFPKTRALDTSSGGGSVELCESSGQFSCAPLLECIDNGGEILNNYFCSGSYKCCSIKPAAATCTELNGQVCSSGERCTSTQLPSSDGSCCTGRCEPIILQEDQCTISGGTCRSLCDSDTEEESADQCSAFSDVCCLPKESSSSSSWIWIVLLIVLIVLAILAILYRKKLQLWYFKFKNKKDIKVSPIQRRPAFSAPLPPSTRPFAPQQPVHKPNMPSRLDKEMEETLRKLKEMSK